MPTEETCKELLSLTEEVEAQLEYLRELGVSYIAAPDDENQAATSARPTVVSATAPSSVVPAYQSPALKRNAEAEARRASEVERAARAHVETHTPPQPKPVAPPAPAGRAAHNSEQAE